MSRINKTELLVQSVLVANPATRADDFILINEVYKKCLNTSDVTLEFICKNHKQLNLPPFATILRCRRKIQQKRKDLVNPYAAQQRNEAAAEFKEYALN